MKKIVFLSLLALSACHAGQPIVEKKGVDQAQEQSDMADCVKHQKPEWGNPIAICMRKKGYHILYGG